MGGHDKMTAYYKLKGTFHKKVFYPIDYDSESSTEKNLQDWAKFRVFKSLFSDRHRATEYINEHIFQKGN